MSIAALNAQLGQYRVFRGQVSNLVTLVGQAFNRLEMGALKIGEHYAIDDSRADNNELQDCRNVIDARRNSLAGSVIPAIDREIARIQSEIHRLEEEARAEAARAEAEAAARAAQVTRR